jgi:CheY-like chemotaxis protein
MRALLVDDDPSIRAVISRILMRQFDTLDLVECKDGVEALEELTRDTYAFILLDLSMPNMDGFDVLESLRATPSLGTLPVIMMTGVNEEHTVRRILSVGVTDYILKPIRPAQLCERVGRIMAKSTTAMAERRDLHEAPFTKLELNARTHVVVADGSDEFRQFFRQMLSPVCRVDTTSSGLDAFQRCMLHAPYAVFIGSDLGAVGGEMLARKLHTNAKLAGIRIIGIEPQSSLEDARRRGTREAVIARSLVPEVFLDGLNALLGSPIVVSESPAAESSGRAPFVSR